MDELSTHSNATLPPQVLKTWVELRHVRKETTRQIISPFRYSVGRKQEILRLCSCGAKGFNSPRKNGQPFGIERIKTFQSIESRSSHSFETATGKNLSVKIIGHPGLAAGKYDLNILADPFNKCRLPVHMRRGAN